MENSVNIHFIDKVVDALKKSAIELEEFQVQAALGKAEAELKFEEIKKKFNNFIHLSKTKINEGKDASEDIQAKFETLRVQLALGKADTLEKFKDQKKQLLMTLHELEVSIKTNATLKRIYALLLIEIEMFKVSLEILEKKFDENKADTLAFFEKGKEDFNKFTDSLKAKYTTKEETKWEHFQSEITEAFSHLKQAFEKKS